MTALRPILIVEDDDTLRQTLMENVAASGQYECIEASTLAQAQQYVTAANARFDLVILDIALPDGDGRDFCASLRSNGHQMPVIILTGGQIEDGVEKGLSAGANDYIMKPFRSNELVARIEAHLRSFDNSEHAVFTIGPYTFRPAAMLLVRTDNGKQIRLTSKEVLILKYLYRAGDKTTSRQVLLNEVWGYRADVMTHTLETHIYRLRQKMETDPAKFVLLTSQPGGYRLDAMATVAAPNAEPAEKAGDVVRANDGWSSWATAA